MMMTSIAIVTIITIIICPLIINPPLGGQLFVTINLDGGTITPLINKYFWSNLPRILKIGGFVVDRKSID